MTKSPDAFRTISEVADWLGIQAHVLRFWESKFTQVKPIKRAGGRRYYRPADMLLLGGIKKLLHEDGLTIKGVQKILREEGMGYVSDMSAPLDELTLSQLDDVVEARDVKLTLEHPTPVEEEKGVILSFEAPQPENTASEKRVAETPTPEKPDAGEPVSQDLFENDTLPLWDDTLKEASEVSEPEAGVTPPQEAPEAEDVPAVEEEAPEAELIAAVEEESPEAELIAAVEEKAPEAEDIAAAEEDAPEAEDIAAAEEEAPEAEDIAASEEDAPEAEDIAAAEEETPEAEVIAAAEEEVLEAEDIEEDADAVSLRSDEASDSSEQAAQSEDESEVHLPDFLRNPMTEPEAPADESQHGFEQADINSNILEDDDLPESAPPAPLPRVIDMPVITPESEIMANPGTLSTVYRLRKLGSAQATDIEPLLARLASLRDSMASRRLRDSTYLRRQSNSSPEAND